MFITQSPSRNLLTFVNLDFDSMVLIHYIKTMIVIFSLIGEVHIRLQRRASDEFAVIM